MPWNHVTKHEMSAEQVETMCWICSVATSTIAFFFRFIHLTVRRASELIVCDLDSNDKRWRFVCFTRHIGFIHFTVHKHLSWQILRAIVKSKTATITLRLSLCFSDWCHCPTTYCSSFAQVEQQILSIAKFLRISQTSSPSINISRCVPLPSVYVSCSRRHRQRALYIVRYSWAADGYYPTASPSEPEPIVTPALTKTGGKEHRVARSTSDTTSIYPKTVLPYRRGARRGIANCANDEVYLRYQAVSKWESNLHSLLLKQASNATNTNQFCTSNSCNKNLF